MNEHEAMKDKQYLVIYHDNCIDGITSAAVVCKYLISKYQVSMDNISFIPASYDMDINLLYDTIEMSKIDIVYIVDFSFSINTLENTVKMGAHTVRMYDHHASAFRKLLGEDYDVAPDSREIIQHEGYDITIVLDNDECGASLLHKELFPTVPCVGIGEPPVLIQYVKDYDLWRFKLSKTKRINKFLNTQRKSPRIFMELLTDFEGSLFEEQAITIGHTILDYEDKIENSLIAGGMTDITIDGVKGLVVNAPHEFSNNIAGKLAKISGTFGATYIQRKDGVVNFSLRSDRDNPEATDVSKMAELFTNGGGHKNAAGFSFIDPLYDDKKGITLWSVVEPARAPSND